jgi:hypothetical protein
MTADGAKPAAAKTAGKKPGAESPRDLQRRGFPGKPWALAFSGRWRPVDGDNGEFGNR